MRVALISPLFESVPPRLYGGTERVVSNLCRGLHDADIEVTLFASGDSTTEARLVPIIDEAIRLRAKPFADPVAWNFRMLAEVARRADEFDVIHNHHDYWMLPLTRMTQRPVLTTVHGRMDQVDAIEAYRGWPDAKLVSISDSQRRPSPQLRWLRTIHHGIDVGNFNYHPQPGSYLAFLGRMTPEKRPEQAIEIARRAGIPLKMAAKIEGKESQAYFDTYVRPHVDGRNVEFVGEISEAEKSGFLGNALALVFPIDWPEPFGLVIIEALACGTPVLARPIGAVPELLKEGITGFSHLDIDVLARRAMDCAALDRSLCRAWVAEKFSLSRMTEDYIHVYRHLVEFAGSRARIRSGVAGLGLDRGRRNFVHSVERAADRDPQDQLQG